VGSGGFSKSACRTGNSCVFGSSFVLLLLLLTVGRNGTFVIGVTVDNMGIFGAVDTLLIGFTTVTTVLLLLGLLLLLTTAASPSLASSIRNGRFFTGLGILL